MKLTIDFETRSTCNLTKTTSWVYAEHPLTQIMCMAFKVDDDLPGLWVPPDVIHLYDIYAMDHTPDFYHEYYIDPIIGELDRADIIEAHYLEFEVAMWTENMVPLGFPDLREEPYFSKLRCSASSAAMHSLPRSLGKAGSALGLPIQKDKEGHDLMMKMCKPRKPRKAEREADPLWESKLWYHETPEMCLRQAIYCARDVDAEHLLSETLGPLTPSELRIWRADQRANWHGVVIDQDLCRKMIIVRDAYLERIAAEFKELTGLRPSQNKAYKDWLNLYGVPVTGVDAVTVDELLNGSEGELHPVTRRTLEIRQAFAKTSLAKLDTALNNVGSDGRMRSTLMYHGAGTGRWSGKGMQLQNLPSRGLIKTIELCTKMLREGADIDTIEIMYPGQVQLALSSCIRGIIVAEPGMTFYSADFSSIEGRVLAWLAGDQHIIQGYIDGLDMYKVAATSVYTGVSYEQVTKAQRQVGKIPELGGGYGGGWRAYAGFAKKEKLRCPPEIAASLKRDDYWEWYIREEDRTEENMLTQEEAEYCKWFSPIVKAWRANRPGTVALWKGLEDACLKAVTNVGEVFSYAGIWFGVNKNDFLKIRLPSGRCLFYYEPRIKMRGGKTQVSYMSTDSSKGGAWRLTFTYGGKITENVVQAIARDLMTDAMVRIDDADLGIDLLFTVHDELVEEGPEGAIALKDFEDLMSVCPDWAAGCPIGAEGWIGKYYRK